MDKTYVVILAGGSGERLWPLSRKNQPKQLLLFTQQKTLLEQTVDRALQLVSKEYCIIVTVVDQEKNIKPSVKNAVGLIISELESRNTAAAMILAAHKIKEKDPEALLVFLPADHYIPDTKQFNDFVAHALDFSKTAKKITLLGLKPTHPATGYGYLEYEQGLIPAAVKKFHEKPDKETAQRYVKKGFLWNSGIFISSIDLFLKDAQKYLPETVKLIEEAKTNQKAYYKIEPISVDKGIMEKSQKLAVLPVNFVWCDVGNFETFLSLRQSDKVFDRVVSIDSKNNLVDVQEGIVALVGVENLCVIQHDKVLLVAHRDQSEKVKQVLDVLRKDHKEEYL
jgi:mannose-1-phosphate guanylyltransferase/mannose-6-phosphate isomerase